MHISMKVLINVKIVEIRHQDTTDAVRGVVVLNKHAKHHANHEKWME